jgi:crossover junction endodeoxyribonuclease RusA
VATRQPRKQSKDLEQHGATTIGSVAALLPKSGGIRTESVIRFQVHGLPIAQGSLRSWIANGKPVITTTAKGLSTWRRLVADVAQRFAPEEPWEGPVGIELDFGLPKPKSAPKRRRVWPDKRPDLDKLCRAVLDALTYVVFADDSQVVHILATKDYGPPGVNIEVHRIDDSDVVYD